MSPLRVQHPFLLLLTLSLCSRELLGAHIGAECESGYKLMGSSCVRREYGESLPYCDKGWYLGSNGLCEREVRINPKSVCHNNECTEVIEQLPELQCDSNYVLNSDVCYSETYGETKLICEQGTMDDRSGQCVVRLSEKAKSVCGGKDESCDLIDFKQPLQICNSGFSLVDGECKSAKIADMAKYCPKGFIASSSFSENCIRERKTKGIEVCPAGSSLHKGKCTIAMETIPEYKCKNKHDLMIGNECISIKTEDPSLTCAESGYKLDKKSNICTNTFHSEPISQCPPGFTMKGHKCEQLLSSKPMPICEKGTLHIDSQLESCIEEKVSKPTQNCPHGFKMDQFNQCSRVITQKPNYICKNGTLSDKKCEITQTLNPIEQCSNNNTLINGQCVTMTKSKANVKCPKGFHLNQNLQCFKTHKTEPTYQCPNGTQQHKKK